MNHIIAILEKEWIELRQERSLVWSTLLPPLLLALLPVIALLATAQSPDDDLLQLGAVLADPALAGLTISELSQAIVGRALSALLLILPILVPSTIAAYSIIGEKTRRTLEPLLATPIRTGELLLAKSLVALLPAVLITWLGAAIFASGVALVAITPRVFTAIVSAGWVLAILLCVPPLALIVVAASVAISARVNDPRTAQQLSGVLVVPVVGVVIGQLSGVVVLNPLLAIVAALVLAAIAAGGVWLAVRLFQRETILTRWT